jgi:hypothetical protein
LAFLRMRRLSGLVLRSMRVGIRSLEAIRYVAAAAGSAPREWVDAGGGVAVVDAEGRGAEWGNLWAAPLGGIHSAMGLASHLVA